MPRKKYPRVDTTASLIAQHGRYVSLADAAVLFGLSTRTLRRMINRKQLEVIRVGHGRGVLRVAEQELARVIAEGRRRALH